VSHSLYDSAKDYVLRCIRGYETHGMRAIAYRSQRLPEGRCFRIVLCFLALILCLPTVGHSQTADFTPEVFGGIGLGRLSRSGNTRISPGVTLDDSASISAGFGLRHRSGFGLEIEFSRMLDPSPRLLVATWDLQAAQRFSMGIHCLLPRPNFGWRLPIQPFAS